jgi:hypothetical protein
MELYHRMDGIPSEHNVDDYLHQHAQKLKLQEEYEYKNKNTNENRVTDTPCGSKETSSKKRNS